ncbi:hypothetical protein, partial [Parasedimentitalea maritima]|uniref:hypothetical protein n=1 Tax=Parasedimentitalea maritima TaxID=2578117 RepID=UPI001ADA7A73
GEGLGWPVEHGARAEGLGLGAGGHQDRSRDKGAGQGTRRWGSEVAKGKNPGHAGSCRRQSGKRLKRRERYERYEPSGPNRVGGHRLCAHRVAALRALCPVASAMGTGSSPRR